MLQIKYYSHLFLMSRYKFIIFLVFYFICIQIYYFNYTPVAECTPSTNLGNATEIELHKYYDTVEAQATKYDVYRTYKGDALQKIYELAQELYISRDKPNYTTKEGKEILTIYHFIYEHKLLVIENERLQNQANVLNQEVARLNERNEELQITLEDLRNQEHQRLLDGVEQGREHQEEQPIRSWLAFLCLCCEKSYSCIQNTPILFAVSVVLFTSVGVNIVQFSFC